ncbi:MAG: ferrous iron transport protein A [Syntrophales bacterium]|nr:ferrous iron transport protein A [Syntrophales bacterium]
MTLANLKPGQSALIVRITTAGALKRRLMDMGIVAGAPVRVEKVAPLGDPIEISIKHYRLSLRRSEAQGVEVETII